MTKQNKPSDKAKLSSSKPSSSFWPTTKVGKVGMGISIFYILFFFGPLGVVFEPIITNVSSSKWFVAGVNIGLIITSLIFLLIAKLNKKDKASSITIALIFVGLTSAFGALFVLGEILFPHS